MSLKTGSRWSNWAWDKPVKAFIWRSSRICRPIGRLPPWFFEDSLPHLLLRNNSIDKLITLVVDLLKHLAEILTGFQRIECFNGGTRLVIHRITLVDITNTTIETIANPLSTS